MTTSNKGIEFITSFESLQLSAYKALPTEKYYTIGYGHYGEDVTADMKITINKAKELLKSDLTKFEGYVNKLNLAINQNQFDALVSFTYNCGPKNLHKLVLGRTLSQIADDMPLYCKAGGKELRGLKRRREAERKLFLEV